MADNNNESEGLFSLRNLLFLLLSAILSGLLVFQSNWEPKRPAPEKDPRHEEGIQLDARLWMDPLELPRRDLAGDASHATGEADFGGQIIRHLTDPANQENKLRILTVMLEGDPYAESTERRRRTRYAVLSGLMASEFGYQPEDRNHIRYLRLERPFDYYDPHHEPRVLSKAERLMPAIIPYEWFQADDKHKQGAPVLVLWLDEGQISERPLQKLLVIKNLLRLFPMAALYDKEDTGAVLYRETLLQMKLKAILAKDSPTQVVKKAKDWTDHLLGKLHSKQEKQGREILTEWLKPLEILWECGHRKNTPTDTEKKQCEEANRFINPKRPHGRKGKPWSNTGKIPLDLPPHSYLFQILGASASAEVITKLGGWLKDYAEGTKVAFSPDTYDFRIIGPASSDTLKAMVQDIQSEQFPERTLCADHYEPVKDPIFTLYSPAASATESQLIGGNDDLNCCLKYKLLCCPSVGNSSTSPEKRWQQDCPVVPPYPFTKPSSVRQFCRLSDLLPLFRNRGVDLRRMIETDEQLADALVEELGKRDIETRIERMSVLEGAATSTMAETGSGCNDEAGRNQPSGQQDPDCRVDVSIRDHVALVFESDTAYARGLKDSLVESLCRKDAKDAPLVGPEKEACRRLRESLSFSYFQGLDGEGGAKPKFDNARTGKQGSAGNAPASLEDLIRLTRPEPTKASFSDDQTDYLERIAAEMQIRDQNLRRHQQSIRAIGLLGGDVFDKIMLLTALRPRFPDVAFFTTELDNRYVDGTADPLIARNLLIASNFDVKREPGVQRFIPPFRSSDQTAYFSATLAALKPDSPISYQHYGRPQLFEVGRTRMFPLSYSHEPTANGIQSGSDCAETGLCAASHWSLPSCHRVVPMTILFFVVVVSVVLVTPKQSRGLLMLLFCAALAGFGIIFWGISQSTEPFSWTEGVSIWPTEFIRLAAIVVGLYFLAGQYRRGSRLTGEKCPDSVEDSNNRDNHPYYETLHDKWCLWFERKFPLIAPVVSLFEGVLKLSIRILVLITFLAICVIGLLLVFMCLAHLSSQKELILINLSLIILSLVSVFCIIGHQKSTDINIEKSCKRIYKVTLPKFFRFVLPDDNKNRLIDNIIGYWVYAPLLLTISFAFISLWTPPVVPARDVLSFRVDKALLVIAIVIYLLLLSTAIEATRKIYRWLKEDDQKIGQKSDVTAIAKKIDEIACRTAAVQKQIFKPFVILTLMLISRNRAFDNWVVSPGLLAIFLMGFGLMAACAFFVWQPARQIREDARKEFRKEDHGKETDRSRALESSEGAYGGVLTGPFVKGMMLLVAGGAGFDPLLEKLISWIGR